MSQHEQPNDARAELLWICHDFEEQWTLEQRLDYRAFLKKVGNRQRGQLFKMLVSIDQERLSEFGMSLDPHEFSHLGNKAVRFVEKLVEMKQSDGAPTESIADTDAGSYNDTAPFFMKSEWIGPYQLVRELGVGGMGAVWLARQTSPVKRHVAIKLIRTVRKSREIISRFERERQTLALMDHPNIATILDAGEVDEVTPYFVMEHVAGLTITEFCDQNRLTIKERLELFIDICRAFEHAHEKGILHRDIKPSNILVKKIDGRPVAKVIDFGLAKVLESDPANDQQTEYTAAGAILGTISYMSPEQSELNPSLLKRTSDVYSLGLVLYELLVGELPVTRDEISGLPILKVLEIIRNRETPPAAQKFDQSDRKEFIAESRQLNPQKLRAVLAGDLANILRKATVNAPNNRYQSTGELSQDIQRFLNFEVVSARPYSRTYQARKYVLRNKIMFLSAVTVFLVFLSGFILSSTFAFLAIRFASEAKQAQVVNAELQKRLNDASKQKAPENRAPDPKPELFDQSLELQLDHISTMSPAALPDLLVLLEKLPARKVINALERHGIMLPKTTSTEPVRLVQNSIGMRLSLLPAGNFVMGNAKGDRGEKPVREVSFDQPFYMGAHEVTVGQFQEFVKATKFKTHSEKNGGSYYRLPNGNMRRDPSYNWMNPGFPQDDSHPVVNVNFYDAQKFCEWLSEETGKSYRIPSDAEWEYGCRAGTATLFQTGDDHLKLREVGNVRGNEDGFDTTSPVGKFRPNDFGLYDMHGNVMEWTTRQSRTGTRSYRGLRGGSFSAGNPWLFYRSSFKYAANPISGGDSRGFRVVRKVHETDFQIDGASALTDDEKLLELIKVLVSKVELQADGE